MINKQDIIKAIQELGIADQLICIHSSFKSFGPVDGGVEALLQAFEETECTVMAPAFTYDNEVFPPLNMRPKRNGAGDYSYFTNRKYNAPNTYTPESNMISKESMGIVPSIMLTKKGRERGNHPLNSFVALGKKAHELIAGQSAENVYAPFEELCRQAGFVLLMGVDLDRATILHYAEQKAGRNLFVRWANNAQGITEPVMVGSCSEGFCQFTNLLTSIEKTMAVGGSRWRCFPAKALTDICAKAIKRRPDITHCGDPHCDRCNDAIQGGSVPMSFL